MQGRALCSFALSMKPWVWGFFEKKPNQHTYCKCLLCENKNLGALSFPLLQTPIRHSPSRNYQMISLLSPKWRSFFLKKKKLAVGWSKLWHLELQSCYWILQHCWALLKLLEHRGGDWKMARVRFAFYTTNVIKWVLWLHGCICLFWPVRCQSLHVCY